MITIVCIYPLQINLTLRELLNINILPSGLMRNLHLTTRKSISSANCTKKLDSFTETEPASLGKRITEAVIILPSDLLLVIAYHTGYNREYGTHHCILYDKVDWSLTERCNKHWYLFIGKLPPYISVMLDWNLGPYLTRSNNWLMLKVPRAASEFRKSAFYFSANSWNDVQHKLKTNTLLTFVWTI